MAFVTCPSCARHVRRNETTCPFCEASVVERIAQTPERAFPTARLSRAALVALAAASVGAIDACGSLSPAPEYGGPPFPPQSSGGVTTMNGSGGSAVGGAVPSSGGWQGAGGSVVIGGAPGAGGGLVAAYGAPIFTGGRSNGGAGAESNDSGTGDADTDAASSGGTGGHSAAPLYGLPPIKP